MTVEPTARDTVVDSEPIPETRASRREKAAQRSVGVRFSVPTLPRRPALPKVTTPRLRLPKPSPDAGEAAARAAVSAPALPSAPMPLPAAPIPRSAGRVNTSLAAPAPSLRRHLLPRLRYAAQAAVAGLLLILGAHLADRVLPPSVAHLAFTPAPWLLATCLIAWSAPRLSSALLQTTAFCTVVALTELWWARSADPAPVASFHGLILLYAVVGAPLVVIVYWWSASNEPHALPLQLLAAGLVGVVGACAFLDGLLLPVLHQGPSAVSGGIPYQLFLDLAVWLVVAFALPRRFPVRIVALPLSIALVIPVAGIMASLHAMF